MSEGQKNIQRIKIRGVEKSCRESAKKGCITTEKEKWFNSLRICN